MNKSAVIKLDFQNTGIEFSEAEISAIQGARDILESREGAGKEYLGWLDLPGSQGSEEIERIESAAEKIRKQDALVVVGIGGSYLGSRAVIDALSNPFQANFPVYFAGHQLDGAYHQDLLNYLKERRYAINVISKSGTTTEPGLAFRFLYNDLKARSSDAELSERVFVTTDATRGSLRPLADGQGLETFTIPDDVGGRFSVLTPVGLLPIAAAGYNIRELLAGARDMEQIVRDGSRSVMDNPALAYALYRNHAYGLGKKVEVLASYRNNLSNLAEWWKQLFGESEGKNGKGIFPASVNLTTDLHSMGQYLQDGERIVFETVLDVVGGADLKIPDQKEDLDGLNYLAGRSLDDVNRTALQATMQAHTQGGVPCLRLEIPEVSERTLGGLLYMFEYACGVSAYHLGVNPFDQPGVEDYKKHMFQLLGKPGY